MHNPHETHRSADSLKSTGIRSSRMAVLTSMAREGQIFMHNLHPTHLSGSTAGKRGDTGADFIF